MRTSSPRGFTLLELIIVVAIMAILATAGLVSGIRVQQQFSFLAEFKQVQSILRQPRIHAITQLGVPDSTDQDGDTNETESYIPPAYGAHIAGDTITIFADLAGNDSPGFYKTLSPSQSGRDADLASYTISNPKYALKIYDGSYTDISSLDLLYSPPYADFAASEGASHTTITDSTIILALVDTQNSFARYFVIFTKSGLIEAVGDLSQFGLENSAYEF